MALAFACAAAAVHVALACSHDYAATTDAEDAAPDAPPPPAPPNDAAFEAGCPERFRPAEGTYTYGGLVYSGDLLSFGDASIPTEPFDDPFFATIAHEGDGCFRLTAYLAKGSEVGAKGRHVHSWRFCNACDRTEGSLDVTDETDDFVINGVASQHTTFTCTLPNPYLVTDVAVDGTVTQGACTGTSTGTESRNVQLVPTSYVYEGIESVGYVADDASVDTRRFRRLNQAIVTGGDPDMVDTSRFWFDVDSGVLMRLLVITHTNSQGAKYQFSVVATRVSSTVSPPLVDP